MPKRARRVRNEGSFTLMQELSIDGARGAPLTLAEGGIAEATIGTGTAPAVSTDAVTAEAFGGMRYVFVPNHAMPTGSSRVTQLKDGMVAWINSLTAQDQAAILIAGPEAVRLAADFNADKAVEYAGKNMLCSAIRQAIGLAGRRDDALLRSSCAVVCPNGADICQAPVTGERLSRMLAAERIPLYVAGFACTARKEALVGLMNPARSSGGWSEDATSANDHQALGVALGNRHIRIMGG